MTGLNSFENAFPSVNQFVSNPRAWWDRQVVTTQGTYLDYGAWVTEPLSAFDSLTLSVGKTLPQAAAMAYGMAPTLATAGPTVGEFLINTKNLGNALGQSVVRAADNVGSKMLPPPPPAFAMAGGGVMAMSGEVGEAVVAGGVRSAGLPIFSRPPMLPIAMAVGQGDSVGDQSPSVEKDRALARVQKNQGHFFPKGTRVQFIEDRLYAKFNQKWRFHRVDFVKGTEACFSSQNGALEWIDLVQDQEIQGFLCAKEERVEFFTNGRLKSAKLARSSMIQGNRFKRGTVVAFYQEGELRSAYLADSIEVEGVEFPATTELEFKRNGQLSR